MITPSQRGIALIDVLLAMLVIGVGVLSIQPLQVLIAHSNAATWQRTIASELAQQKLEDLRSYSQLAMGEREIFGFDEIGNRHGGQKTPQSGLRLGTEAQARSGTLYVLSWTARDLAWCDGYPELSLCPASWRAEAKRVQVTVEWDSFAGDAQVIRLESVLAALEPGVGIVALLRRPHSRPPQISLLAPTPAQSAIGH